MKTGHVGMLMETKMIIFAEQNSASLIMLEFTPKSPLRLCRMFCSMSRTRRTRLVQLEKGFPRICERGFDNRLRQLYE